MERHEQVLIALRRIIRALDLQSKWLMQTAGLTGPQLTILDVLGRDGPTVIGKLARAVSLSQGTVTTVVDRLEARGLVRRERSAADKRRVVVALSEVGERTLKDSPTLLQEGFISRFGELEEWEQSLILASLQRVERMMRTHEADTPTYRDPLPPLGDPSED